MYFFFFYIYGYLRELPVLTHSFPTRRSMSVAGPCAPAGAGVAAAAHRAAAGMRAPKKERHVIAGALPEGTRSLTRRGLVGSRGEGIGAQGGQRFLRPLLAARILRQQAIGRGSGRERGWQTGENQ